MSLRLQLLQVARLAPRLLGDSTELVSEFFRHQLSANGAGLDRAGRVLGARRLTAYRYVILPAAFPSFLGGLKQGWAFLWRSLMAAEVVGAILDQRAIGVRLEFAGQASNAPELMATMITILAIGILVDSLFFGQIERSIRRRWGLVETAA